MGRHSVNVTPASCHKLQAPNPTKNSFRLICGTLAQITLFHRISHINIPDQTVPTSNPSTTANRASMRLSLWCVDNLSVRTIDYMG